MESIEIPSELMEESTIKKIGNSLGNVIGFEDNFYRDNKIRVLVKINQIFLEKELRLLTFSPQIIEIIRTSLDHFLDGPFQYM